MPCGSVPTRQAKPRNRASKRAALLHWLVPAQWFVWLVVLGCACSIVLQVLWLSPWAVLPLLVDAALAWAIFGMHVTVIGLRR